MKPLRGVGRLPALPRYRLAACTTSMRHGWCIIQT